MMYSRRFDGQGSVVPPDYSGVAYRREPPPDAGSAPAADPLQRPRRALYDRPAEAYPSSPEPPAGEAPKREPPPPKEESRSIFSGFSGLRKHSFTFEDIALAGLILLLLNKGEEGDSTDSDLLLLLGFLLLGGL